MRSPVALFDKRKSTYIPLEKIDYDFLSSDDSNILNHFCTLRVPGMLTPNGTCYFDNAYKLQLLAIFSKVQSSDALKTFLAQCRNECGNIDEQQTQLYKELTSSKKTGIDSQFKKIHDFFKLCQIRFTLAECCYVFPYSLGGISEDTKKVMERAAAIHVAHTLSLLSDLVAENKSLSSNLILSS